MTLRCHLQGRLFSQSHWCLYWLEPFSIAHISMYKVRQVVLWHGLLWWICRCLHGLSLTGMMWVAVTGSWPKDLQESIPKKVTMQYLTFCFYLLVSTWSASKNRNNIKCPFYSQDWVGGLMDEATWICKTNCHRVQQSISLSTFNDFMAKCITLEQTTKSQININMPKGIISWQSVERIAQRILLFWSLHMYLRSKPVASFINFIWNDQKSMNLIFIRLFYWGFPA